MSKQINKFTAVALGAAGAGAALALTNKHRQENAKRENLRSGGTAEYRNTERGKSEKNSKGIRYTAGNYEAFVRPEKPEGVEEKHAYIVGSGLAALAAACFLVRDGQMPGSHIHILEAMDIAGGACDGILDPARGYIMRGGREMEDHFECLWDLFRSIPSLEEPGASVLDEFYRLNRRDPNYSLCRATVDRGKDAHTDGKFGLSRKARREIVRLFLTPDEDLYDKRIEDVFDDAVFCSNFWLYWRTMFAFENWHSALEMKLYFQRFIHHIAGLPDFSALKFTRYNQYESLILPMQAYLEKAGVDFRFGTEVTNVLFEHRDGKKVATAIECSVGGSESGIALTENDLVFVTNGSCTEGTIYGDQDHAPNGDAEVRTSGCWNLWKNIARQDPAFGRPEKFCSDIHKTNWESATITTLDEKILPYMEKICRRDPRSGRVVTGGIVSCKDSGWLMSWTVNRQGQFKEQDPDRVCVWVYGLFTDRPGDYVKKAMKECTGREITMEWLYHIGVPEDQIPELAEHSALCVPTMMPYITAFFMPRTRGDRPDVIPDGCVNFAFLGQFAETPRDTVFTTEYSVRTAMEAVYGLLGVDRGVPEVWGSVYDVRALLDSTVCLMDGASPLDASLPGPLELLKEPLLKLVRGSVLEKLLKEHGILREEARA
nr:oleate hydratase [uncultured Subdoligranulum sp.]